MPKIRKKLGTFLPPSGRKAQMVRSTMPLGSKEPAPAPPEEEEEGKGKAKGKAKKMAAPAPPAPPEPAARARATDGKLVGDNPATPEVDEAWKDGAGPEWTTKDNKAQLLKVAQDRGIEGLSMTNTKKELIKALEGSDG